VIPILRIGLALLILSWVAVFVHESLHLMAAQLLGHDGRLHLATLGVATFQEDAPYSTGWHDAAIRLSGGIGTGVLFLAFWWLTSRSRAAAEMDNGMPFLALGIGQLIYAPFEFWLYARTDYGALAGILIGLALAALWYGTLHGIGGYDGLHR